MVQKYINVHFLDFQTLSSLDSDMMHDHISSNESILFLCLFSWRICVGCQAEIGHGRFLSCMGGVWHPECFCCNACDKPIIDYEFSMSGNRPYHKLCYKEQHHPKCDVCHNFVSDSQLLLISIFYPKFVPRLY
jgi:hypothetical protein